MDFTQNHAETKASQEIKSNPTKIPLPIKLLAIIQTTEGTRNISER
jgi:hypothetical protein